MRAAVMDGTGDVRTEHVPDPKIEQPVTLAGGPAPVRASVEELLPEVLDGRLAPGRVLDRTVGPDDVAAGYREMDARATLKVLVLP